MKTKIFYKKNFYFLLLFIIMNTFAVTKKVSVENVKDKKVSLRSLREGFVDLMIELVCLIQKVMSEELSKKECNKQKLTDVLAVFEWTTSQIKLFQVDPASYSRADLELNKEKAEKNLLYLQNISLNKEGK